MNSSLCMNEFILHLINPAVPFVVFFFFFFLLPQIPVAFGEDDRNYYPVTVR